MFDNPSQILEVLSKIIRKAGDYVIGSDETESHEKSNANDFVTVADIKSQDILREQIRAAFPGVVCLSEEDTEEQRKAIYYSDFTGFILDPIDGTYNFKRGMKESAVSVGLVVDGKPFVGAVLDPFKDELFTAISGQGVWCNGEPIKRQDVASLDGASICTSNSYSPEAMEENIERQLTIYRRSGVMPWFSCPGSGVLIMAWVALGRIDAYHHNGLKPWDNAAAYVIMSEAGLTITKLDGTPSTYRDQEILVAPVSLHKLISDAIG